MTSGGEPATEVVATCPADESSAPAVPLRVVILTCLVSFAAWEVARLGLARLPESWSSASPLWSSVRAVLLLAPAAFVVRRVLRERLMAGFWLGVPERAGLLRSSLIGAAYLVVINGINPALGEPFEWPSIAAGALAMTLFDAGVEEALFRGFLLSHVMRGRRFARANLLAAAIFLLPHARKLAGFWSDGMRFEVPIMALAIFVMGLALGGTARPVRSIWLSTLVHTVANLFATL